MKARAVLSFLLVTTVALTTNPTAGGDIKNKGVIRSETRLIEIDVVTRDSRGRAVKGLTRDDFKIYDNGKEVPIGLFSALSLTPAPAAPLPPNTFSNRVRGAPPSVTGVLLDGLNTSYQDQTWARREVVRFLEELEPQDRAAIFLLGDRLYTLQNFTSDPKLLLAALRSAKATNQKELDASAPPQSMDEPDQASVNVMGNMMGAPSSSSSVSPETMINGPAGANAALSASIGPAAEASAMALMEQIMMQFQEHESAFFGVDRVERTMDALMAIANYLEQFPGRKNLIWVSASFPISIGFDTPRQPGDTRDQAHFTPEIQRAIKALNNANVAVYPVDARGLVASAPGGMDMNSFYSTVGTMQDLANHTGGQSFYNTNNLARVMRAAVDDSEADYTLGFYPQNVRWDGKYHTLTVKADKPGIHLRYRNGYFATQVTPKTGDEEDTPFNQAIFSPLDSTGLGLTVTIQKFVHFPEGRGSFSTRKPRVLLRIDMDPHNINLPGGAGSNTVDLAMVFAQMGPEGRVLLSTRYDMKLRIAEGGESSLMQRGLMLDKWVELVDGAETLDIVVRDPASGNVGSVRVPLGNR